MTQCRWRMELPLGKQLKTIECIEPGACLGAEMDLIGPINVKYCHFTGEAPMGYALETKCGFV